MGGSKARGAGRRGVVFADACVAYKSFEAALMFTDLSAAQFRMQDKVGERNAIRESS